MLGDESVDYLDVDVPPVAGTRGLLRVRVVHVSATRRRQVKRAGHRRVRHAVSQALRVPGDRMRARGATRWELA